jgi:uncharacterized protein YyaL (SSP411 family)
MGIVIVHPAGGPHSDPRLLATVRATYVPNHVLTVVTEGEALERQRRLVPLVRGKRALGGTSTAYVCERGVCARPTSDPAVLADQLARVHALPDAGGGKTLAREDTGSAELDR